MAKLTIISAGDDHFTVNSEIENQQPIQKIGIDFSKMSEEDKHFFRSHFEDWEYGKQFFFLDDERFNKPPY